MTNPDSANRKAILERPIIIDDNKQEEQSLSGAPRIGGGVPHLYLPHYRAQSNRNSSKSVIYKMCVVTLATVVSLGIGGILGVTGTINEDEYRKYIAQPTGVLFLVGIMLSLCCPCPSSSSRRTTRQQPGATLLESRSSVGGNSPRP